MNKKAIKIITCILAIILLVGFIGNTVLAVDAGTIIESMKGHEDEINVEDSGILQIAGKVMGAIRTVAVIAGVIILMILGFKYMTGSLEEKADYKKSMVPLVVGIIVVMAAAQLITMIFDFF
jgi:type IV secretory pathway VirB2 component (pilin)